MNILALDLGTRTGIAVGEHTAAPMIRSELLADGAEPHGARFYRLGLTLDRVIKDNRPDLMMIERPIVSGPAGKAARAEVAIGLRAIAMMVAHKHHIRFDDVAVSTVRKHFLGHGRVARQDAKKRTIDRCRITLGWIVENDDEADACAIWDYACTKHVPGHQAVPLGDLFR